MAEAGAGERRPAPRSRLARLTSAQWLAVTAGALVVVALVGIGVSLLALHRLGIARTLVVDRVDPARLAASSMETALLDEETGVRGYVLARRSAFLQPYVVGRGREHQAAARLAGLARGEDISDLATRLRLVEARATAWRTRYAEPAIRATRAGARPPSTEEGRQRFDAVRSALRALDVRLAQARTSGRGRLHDAARAATAAALLAGALLLAAALVASATLRAVVASPLLRLNRDVRRVARGNFEHVIEPQGPRDVAELSRNVDSMRRRIIEELDAVSEARERVERQALELQRSNAELEQFAYVASHDLQEPLRKVASFCGMLQHRYHGQLDERADQYIDFAVDGAKRMQVLINDLLAFSRVGRVGREQEIVDMDDVVDLAVGNLDTAIEEAGATVEVQRPLPSVRGDTSLLTVLLQNLVANGIKFRGEDAPRVSVSSRRDGDRWIFTVADNGIGIAPRHAERIFVIFQRLHTKEAYGGTGIGLAMCRKIVEYHGGEIWLDPPRDGTDPGAEADAGARFHFTLPVADEDAENA